MHVFFRHILQLYSCRSIVLHFIVTSVDVELGDGSSVYVSMLPNPSHLEAVNPVALGKTRARQLTLRDGPYSQGPEPVDPTPSSRVLSLQVLHNNYSIHNLLR